MIIDKHVFIGSCVWTTVCHSVKESERSGPSLEAFWPLISWGAMGTVKVPQKSLDRVVGPV